MSTTRPQPTSTSTPSDAVTHLDALIIGAGVAGLYQLHRLREMGMKVRAFETGTGVGGTWYWNRYPGARFDSQAEIYQYWFSEELYKSWQPSERFPAQPETERWLNYVADTLDLKKDIQFSTRIASAHFDETEDLWRIETAAGEKITAQFLIACCGMLSAPLSDRFPGQSTFKGQIFHTGLWPKEPVDWITDCIDYARRNGKKVVEATESLQDEWVQHHDETANKTLVVKTDSWYMGSNVDGKPRRLLSYIGGVGNYNQKCDQLASQGYPGFEMR